MEGPIARIVARSLSRITKQSRSTAIACNLRPRIWSNLTPSPRVPPFPSLTSRRGLSQSSPAFNKTDQVSTNEEATPSTSTEGQVPVEKAPESPVVKPFDSRYEESTIGEKSKLYRFR